MKYTVKNREEWLALREKYITASEAAILLGLNSFSNVKTLREAKAGKDDFKGNANTRVGEVLESVVVEIVNEILQEDFKRIETEEGIKEFYTNEQLGATPDAYNSKGILLECKTTRPDLFLNHKEKPSLSYLLQLQTQMCCTGFEEGILAILSTDLTQKKQKIDWPIVIYKVTYKKKIGEILLEEAQRFLASAETFVENIAYKIKVKTLLGMCYEKI